MMQVHRVNKVTFRSQLRIEQLSRSLTVSRALQQHKSIVICHAPTGIQVKMCEIRFSKQKPATAFFYYTSILQHTQKLTLMICHRKPRTRWVVPFSRSSAPMLTVLQPMERAEFKASVRFSRNAVKSLVDFGLVMARSSTVSGTATLIILLKTKSISS